MITDSLPSPQELKPCPFCGGDPELNIIIPWGEFSCKWSVGCGTVPCVANGSKIFAKKELAIAFWNRRTP